MNRSMHRRSFLALAAATPLLARAAGSADAHAASAVVWLKLQGKATPITPSGGVVHALGFSSDGKQIVADVDKSLYFIDAASGQPAREPFRWNRGFTDKVLLAPSPARAFVSSWAGGRGELAMLDWVADKKAALMTLTKEVRALAVSADGARLALGYADGKFQVVDALRGASLLGPVNAYSGAMEPDSEGKVEIYALAFSADGRRLALAGADPALRFFDAASGRPIGTPVRDEATGLESVVNQMAFTADGKRLLVTTGDFCLHALDVQTNRAAAPDLQMASAATALALSRDGRRLATGHFNGELRRWVLT